MLSQRLTGCPSTTQWLQDSQFRWLGLRWNRQTEYKHHNLGTHCRLDQVEKSAVAEHVFLEDHNMHIIKSTNLKRQMFDPPPQVITSGYTQKPQRWRNTVWYLGTRLQETKTGREVSLKSRPRFHLLIIELVSAESSRKKFRSRLSCLWKSPLNWTKVCNHLFSLVSSLFHSHFY